MAAAEATVEVEGSPFLEPNQGLDDYFDVEEGEEDESFHLYLGSDEEEEEEEGEVEEEEEEEEEGHYFDDNDKECDVWSDTEEEQPLDGRVGALRTTQSLQRLLATMGKMPQAVQLHILASISESTQQRFIQEASIGMAEQVRLLSEASALYSDAAELSPMKRPQQTVRHGTRRGPRAEEKVPRANAPGRGQPQPSVAGEKRDRVQNRRSFVPMSKVYEAPNRILPPEDEHEIANAPTSGVLTSTSAKQLLHKHSKQAQKAKSQSSKSKPSASAVLGAAFGAPPQAKAKGGSSCSHPLMRGPRKGQACGKSASMVVQGRLFCKQHIPRASAGTVAAPAKKGPPTKKSTVAAPAKKRAPAKKKVSDKPNEVFILTGACHLCPANGMSEEGTCVPCEAASRGDIKVRALKHKESKTEGDVSGFLKVTVHKGESEGVDNYRLHAWQLTFVTMDTSFARWEEREEVFERLQDYVMRGETIEWLPIAGPQSGKDYYQLRRMHQADLAAAGAADEHPVAELPIAHTPAGIEEPAKTTEPVPSGAGPAVDVSDTAETTDPPIAASTATSAASTVAPPGTTDVSSAHEAAGEASGIPAGATPGDAAAHDPSPACESSAEPPSPSTEAPSCPAATNGAETAPEGDIDKSEPTET